MKVFKWLFLIIGISFGCFVKAQTFDSTNQQYFMTIRTEAKHDIVYKRIPNNLWFYLAPSKFNKMDVFELKVKSPSVIEKKENNRYLLTPFPDESGFVNIYVYKNEELIDSFAELTREPPMPQLENYPAVNCRTGFYVPFVDYVECEIKLSWRSSYKLRVQSFPIVIKDTNGVVKYTKFLKGNKFSEDDKAAMKKVIDKLKDYRIDYLDVHVTDDKFYRAIFSQVSNNVQNPVMRFYEEE